VQLIFSTLWSKITAQNAWQIERGLNDFRAIKNQGKPFLMEHYNKLHKASVAFLKQSFSQQASGLPSVVVTHHVPTFMNYPEQYKGDAFNQAFATELFDLVADSNASHWIYGHHHSPTPSFIIGGTKLVCNQLGYVDANEHRSFVCNQVLDVVTEKKTQNS